MTAGNEPVEPAANDDATDGIAYEAFVRFGGPNKPIVHVGSVRGRDADLAWHAAKEAYTRREECDVLWVVPRSAVVAGGEGFQPTLAQAAHLGYRLPGYPVTQRRAREQAATALRERDYSEARW